MIQMYKFTLHKLIFRLAGIKIVEDEHPQTSRVVHFVIVIVIGLFNASFTLGGFLFVPQDLYGKCTSLITFLSVVGLVIKMRVFYSNALTVSELINNLEFVQSTDRLARVADWLQKMFVGSLFGVFLIFGLRPLVLGTFEVPFDFVVPFVTTLADPNEIMRFFIFVELLVWVAVLLGAADTFIICVGSQLTTLLMNLNQGFVHAIKIRVLRDCVKEHVRLLSLVKHFGRLSESIFLFQVLSSTLMSCVITLALVKTEIELVEEIKFFFILCTLFSELLVYCWIGENITHQCENVHLSLYCSPWYSSNIRYRRIILTSQINTVKPLVIKGGTLVPMSLNTFLKSLEESVSWFMVLRTITQKT